ncbi:MHYT domain-containingsignaling protein [Purpureocillium lavendulum]|uniref:MHYT domain-containingsignaling protein n=1 Tax=Purpureocillium lavendulum TaxID=1247861 RepID=A0AB34FD81_9HYPO|nr:MHYT domain-containingsignaling protein [Purpureocillium lavendulum]
MSTSQDLLQQYWGKLVPYTFNGGFVFLSYVISLIGTSSTLELMRRRTSHRGFYNLWLLIGAAISMGGIAIWSMHFIGNRAIYMLDGGEAFQIAYSTSLTVLSLLVPILVLIFAFLGVSGTGKIRWWRIGLAGLLYGGAICGMHYLADASISNYDSSYELSFVVGSVVIAVSASTTALSVFFVFEATWKNVWWKRLGCAMILAGAVSGMHWCAAIGTTYRLRHLHSSGNGVSRQEAMIVVICLSVAAGILTLGSAMYSAWIRGDYASKSQQVVLAAAVFDSKGGIMVNQAGLLPTEVITDTFVPKSNDDIFDTGNPLFHWMFRASRNWSTIGIVLNEMDANVGRLSRGANTSGRPGVKLVGDDGMLVEKYDTILRELFCLTAAALASRMKTTLDVGLLWDEIFVTGDSSQLSGKRPAGCGSDETLHQTPHTKDKSILQNLAENGLSKSHLQEYGRGSLMFLVRHVERKRDIEKLQALGYRFAEIHKVVGSIYSSMQIKTPGLEARLRTMSIPDENKVMLEPGVHLGMFAVRARLDRRGFDVLVQKTARYLLPTVPIPMGQLESWQTEFLNRHQNMTVAALAQTLESVELASTQEKLFASDLRNAISTLRQALDAKFDEATLLPRAVQVPFVTREEIPRASTCTLVAFQLVLPIHATVQSTRCEFTPLTFFRLRQFLYDGSPDHLEFSHSVHRSLSYAPRQDKGNSSNAAWRGTHNVNSSLARAVDIIGHALPVAVRRGTQTPWQMSTRSQEQLAPVVSNPRSVCHAIDDGSFEYEHTPSVIGAVTEEERGDRDLHQHRTNLPFGGIMISQEVTIDIGGTHQQSMRDDTVPDKGYSAMATGESGVRMTSERRDYVDDLLSVSMLGRVGCGKSTMISLLERFYDPSSEQIIIDGSNSLTSLNRSLYRRQIALVQQEPVLFPVSIRDNVAMGVHTGIAMVMAPA